MSNVPEDLMYTSSHEWVRDEGDGVVTVGITEHAQEALGDLVFVDAPEVGVRVAAGDTCAVIESVKAASDIYAPVNGEVTEGNTQLTDSPELINSDPYGEGWIMKLRTDSAELGELLDADGYRDVLAAEE